MNIKTKQLLITLALLGAAAIGPNLFVAAQAGIAPLSELAVNILLPVIGLMVLLTVIAALLKYKEVVRLSLGGIVAGIISTIALEAVRESGFHLDMMPGDLPRLMGVLLLDQFASGPDTWSDLAGWGYHFFNGAAFGLIWSLLLGQGSVWKGAVYGLLLAVGFMMSPVVLSLGIGRFGLDFKDGYQFALTVTVAHVAFGVSLSLLLKKWNIGIATIWSRWNSA